VANRLDDFGVPVARGEVVVRNENEDVAARERRSAVPPYHRAGLGFMAGFHLGGGDVGFTKMMNPANALEPLRWVSRELPWVIGENVLEGVGIVGAEHPAPRHIEPADRPGRGVDQRNGRIRHSSFLSWRVGFGGW